MNPIVIGILGILLLFFLLAMRMQIGFAMALVGFLGFTILNSFEAGLGVLGIEAFKTASHRLLHSASFRFSCSWGNLQTNPRWEQTSIRRPIA